MRCMEGYGRMEAKDVRDDGMMMEHICVQCGRIVDEKKSNVYHNGSKGLSYISCSYLASCH